MKPKREPKAVIISDTPFTIGSMSILSINAIILSKLSTSPSPLLLSLSITPVAIAPIFSNAAANTATIGCKSRFCKKLINRSKTVSPPALLSASPNCNCFASHALPKAANCPLSVFSCARAIAFAAPPAFFNASVYSSSPFFPEFKSTKNDFSFSMPKIFFSIGLLSASDIPESCVSNCPKISVKERIFPSASKTETPTSSSHFW